MTLALATARPELALDDNEARDLAKALADVQAQYQVSLDPKSAAWLNLLLIAVPIYGTRTVAIWLSGLRPEPMQQSQTQAAATETSQSPQTKSRNAMNVGGIAFDPTNLKVN